MQELETISKMVLDKQGERPMLIIAWGRFLRMFLECYPESRLTMRAADKRVCACETHGLEYLKDDVWHCGYCKRPLATNA
jgi:hypothetical protein